MGVVLGPDSNHEEQSNYIIVRYEKDLPWMCCVYLRDASLTEAVVQEVFLKAYKKPVVKLITFLVFLSGVSLAGTYGFPAEPIVSTESSISYE